MSKLNDLLSIITSKVNTSVKTEVQSFSEEEKMQARRNVDLPNIETIEKTLEWDGNITNRPYFEVDEYNKYMFVSEDIIDLSRVKNIYMNMGSTLENWLFSNFNFESKGAIDYIYIQKENTVPLIFVSKYDFDEYKKGVYVFYYTGTGDGQAQYISSVTYTEDIIHKENLKYFPEGVGYNSGTGFKIEKLLIKHTLLKDEVGNEGVFMQNFIIDEEIVEGDYYRLMINSDSYDFQCKKDYSNLYPNGSILYLGDTDYLTYIRYSNGMPCFPDLNIYQELIQKHDNGEFKILGGAYNFDSQHKLLINIDYSICSTTEDNIISLYKLSGTPIVYNKIDPNYYERLAYNQRIEEVIYDDIYENVSEGIYFEPKTLEIGAIYNVNINGINYGDEKCYSTYIEDMLSYVIGNGFGELGVESNSTASFWFVFVPSSNIALFVCQDFNVGDMLKIRISKVTYIPKVVDEKYLPKQKYDMSENNMYSKTFIENRPFYNGVLKISTEEAIAAGAYVFNDDFGQYVKIYEYFEPDDSILDSKFCIHSTGHIEEAKNHTVPFRTSCSLRYDSYIGDWEIADFDGVFLFGVSSDYLSNLSDDSKYKNMEPGVYSFGMESIGKYIYIEMLLNKKLDYSQLTNLPFYTQENIINFTNVKDAEHIYRLSETGVENEDETICFYCQCINDKNHDNILDATLYLSDGSTFKITKDNITYVTNDAFGSGNILYLVNDLVLFAHYNMDDIEGVSESVLTIYEFTMTSHIASGIFVNYDTADGVYVTGISFEEPYVKQIEEKYIPMDSIVQNVLKALPTWEGGSY